MMHKSLKIGLTIARSASPGSIWSNGASQNMWFLHQTLCAIHEVGEICWLSVGEGSTVLDAYLPPDACFPAALRAHDMDVIIEIGAYLPSDLAASLRSSGCKLVAYRSGNDYVLDVETAIFNQPPRLLAGQVQYDAIWTLPQHEESCRDYLETVYGCPVHILPHLWAADFHGKRAASQFQKPLRVAILEPNLSLIKSAHIPMLVCELAYRARPELFGTFYVTNSTTLTQHPTFTHFAEQLEIVKRGLATFEPRYSTLDLLGNIAECVVTHQLHNPLNYLYYDVLSLGYPLVHNSPELSGCGYFYPDFAAKIGAQQLIAAAENQLTNPGDGTSNTSAFLAEKHPLTTENVSAHSRALRALF